MPASICYKRCKWELLFGEFNGLQEYLGNLLRPSLSFWPCSPALRGRTRSVEAVPLSGEQVDIGPEESLFEIVCVDDASLVARQYSDISRLCLYDLRSPGRLQEFLHVGRGPFEVHYCTVKSRNDTIYVVSHTPVGLKGIIKIPVNGCGDMTRWRYEDLSYVGIAMGGDFDVCRDGYVVLGDRYGQPNILTKITHQK